ncbi:terminase large subunit [Acidothermaceae bacterium B102]|nr:terminase large subunit [Acidothermaceae bacterium B102]
MTAEIRHDEARAQRAVDFFERILVHTKGKHARKPFLLTHWQEHEIIRPLFGTVTWDEDSQTWLRQYNTAWIELARKNGKSELLSGIALLMLCADDEESAEVYSVACDRDQASLVFNVAKRMVELSPILSKRLTIVDSRKRIIDPQRNGVYAVLPGDAGGALGTNPSAVLFDEVLTQRDRDLWDAMRQGAGTRSNFMLVAATTASYTSAAFCLEEHSFSERVLADSTIAPHRFVFMRNTPKDWDWQDEGQPANTAIGQEATGWYWSNPALGDFLNVSTLRNEAQEAKEQPSAQNAFRVFRLNQWVSQASRWLDMSVWDANAGLVDREQLKGRPCFGGLDLASTSDFTAWVLVFREPEGYTVLPHFWLPQAAVDKRAPMRENVSRWGREGFLTITPGDAVDYDAIEAHIARDAEDFQLQMFGFDPWNATQVVQHLEGGGLTAVKVPQTVARLNDPCKELERQLANRAINHGGHPVLRWHADNVELDITPDGLMKPSRKRSTEKIDGIAALVNALFVALVPAEPPAVVPQFISL